ncbi:MAG TPA: metal-dependent hydrolase, partial [Betaproteobacteria bacterium]|nr:metal-dependent hydrolase [Betaproteobacteria bacterium]
QFHKVDVMLACIGDHFTMGPDRAALATKLVAPRVVIPMHYGTFPVLNGTPAEFKAALAKDGVKSKLVVMQPDETLKF